MIRLQRDALQDVFRGPGALWYAILLGTRQPFAQLYRQYDETVGARIEHRVADQALAIEHGVADQALAVALLDNT